MFEGGPWIDWQSTGILAGRPSALLLLLAALVLDGALPNMPWLFRWLPHPAAAVRRLTALLDRKLNREARSERNRVLRGALVVAVVVALALAAGWLLAAALARLEYGWIGEILAVAMLIAQRGVLDRTAEVRRALATKRLAAARAAVRPLVGRDAQGLDAHGVARAAIEACADTFSRGVVGPAFWYVLLGLPGLFAHVGIKSMDREIGYRSPRHAAFGLAAARLDDAASFLPARLAGLLLALAAILAPTARPAGAFATMLRDARKHRSPSAGWPEGAMAGALGLALAGPRSYGGRKTAEPWLGRGRAQATANDVARARVLFVTACLLHAALVAALAYLLRTS